MLKPILKDSQTLAFAYPTNGTGVNMSGPDAQGFTKVAGIIMAITVSTPAAATFTAVAATDIMTATAHGMLTGLVVQVSNSGGGLPAGLSAATNYYVIYIDANTFYLATSLVNAQAGTKIDITTNGTGTQTVTPTALATCSVKLQGSMDNSVWADVPIQATGDASKTSAITATGNILLKVMYPTTNYVRCAYTLASGQLSITQTTLLKGR